MSLEFKMAHKFKINLILNIKMLIEHLKLLSQWLFLKNFKANYHLKPLKKSNNPKSNK